MAIRHWPATRQPREKLIISGPAALSDAELLAIFLRSGLPGQSAIELAQSLLRQFDGLHGLIGASHETACHARGLGSARWATLQAAGELARRTLLADLQDRNILTTPAQVRSFLTLWLRDRPSEAFIGLFLDNQNQLLEAVELFRGTLTQTAVYPREVMRRALELNAGAVIFAHNHPSGVAEPSHADRLLTDALKTALAHLDVRVLDHLIVAGNQTLSFAERGLL